MIHIPRLARVPLTAKVPEACPHCGSHVLTRRGTRKKKLEIVQLWRCGSCKRVFTPGPAALSQQDLSAPHDPIRADGLQSRLLPARDGRASQEENQPTRVSIDHHDLVGGIQRALQLSP